MELFRDRAMNVLRRKGISEGQIRNRRSGFPTSLQKTAGDGASFPQEEPLCQAPGNPGQPVILAQVTTPLQKGWLKMHCAYSHPDNIY